MNSREELGEYLNNLGLIGIGAEIGVRRGYFSNKILEKWKGKKLILVDPWKVQEDYISDINKEQNENYEEVLKLVARYPDKIDIYKARSGDASRLIADKSLDFVYIDANHDYEHVCEDIFYWFPKIKKGGIISGHDYIEDGEYFNEIVGVKSAVDEFVEEFELKLNLTTGDICNEEGKFKGLVFKTWWIVKE